MEKLLKLRPHHIPFLNMHLKISENSEVSYEIYNNWLAEVYGPENVHECDDITKKIKENPDMEVMIVMGIDELCQKCRFKESCERKEYSEVDRKIRHATMSSLDFDPGEGKNPELADLGYLKKAGLVVGGRYKASELFAAALG